MVMVLLCPLILLMKQHNTAMKFQQCYDARSGHFVQIKFFSKEKGEEKNKNKNKAILLRA